MSASHRASSSVSRGPPSRNTSIVEGAIEATVARHYFIDDCWDAANVVQIRLDVQGVATGGLDLGCYRLALVGAAAGKNHLGPLLCEEHGACAPNAGCAPGYQRYFTF
jgi:hypothetical protein